MQFPNYYANGMYMFQIIDLRGIPFGFHSVGKTHRPPIDRSPRYRVVRRRLASAHSFSIIIVLLRLIHLVISVICSPSFPFENACPDAIWAFSRGWRGAHRCKCDRRRDNLNCGGSSIDLGAGKMPTCDESIIGSYKDEFTYKRMHPPCYWT